MSLEKQKILRINCPGYGHQSYFSTGCAQPLYEYSAIIVNPISILHLFDKDPDLLRQVEEAQVEEMSSYSAKSDKLIESLNPELDQRMAELVKFLEQGGLLIYYLCRPFTVQGPTVTMDNYSWLDVLAPDKPHEKNERHMASVSHGKNIEVTSEGQSSPFVRYLRQAGLEWTTLIRAENLTEGYNMLATAGPNKCVSAYLNAGDQGGTVVFLPAPYIGQFDDTLINCLELWDTRRAIPGAKPAARPVNLEHSPAAAPTVESKPAATAEPPPAARAPESPPPSATPSEPPEASSKPASDPAQSIEFGQKPGGGPQSSASTPPPGSAPAKEPPKAAGNHQQEEHKPGAAPERPISAAGEEVVPKAKDLIEKMEGISKTPAPEWCQKYTFADLEKMREELNSLNETIRMTQGKIEKVEGRIRTMEGLKNALLAADGDELHQACTRVFEQLGWTVKAAPGFKGEFWLMDGDSTAAIVRIIRTASKPKSADVAQLAESIISYWGEHEEEPKGVLLASTYANRPPVERTEEDYSDGIADFAKKKNLCLMTCVQLLSIYRDVESDLTPAKELRDQILSTSGRLPSFSMEPRMAATAS